MFAGQVLIKAHRIQVQIQKKIIFAPIIKLTLIYWNRSQHNLSAVFKSTDCTVVAYGYQILKVFPVTLLTGFEAAILTITCRNPPVDLKIHPRSRLGHLNLRGFSLHPMRGEQWRKSTNNIEGSWYRNYYAASGQILKISKGFHKSKQIVISFLSSTGI